MGRHRWAALALGLAAMLQAPVAVADEASYEAYRAILGLFTAGADTTVYFDGSYPTLIAPHIRGNWAALRFREAVADAETLDDVVGRQCENGPTIVNPLAPSRVVMQRTNTATEQQMTYDYLYVIGATFSPRIDPMEMIAFFGFDRPGLEQTATAALADAQADSEIYVVNDDMFVLVRNTQLEFYLRCPGDDGLGDRDLAIEDTLWRALALNGSSDLFDAQLRAAYLDCGRKLLAPATRDDVVAMVNAVDQGEEASDGFGNEHPDIAEGLARCIVAAEAAANP